MRCLLESEQLSHLLVPLRNNLKYTAVLSNIRRLSVFEYVIIYLQERPMPPCLMQSAVWLRSTEAEEILKFR